MHASAASREKRMKGFCGTTVDNDEAQILGQRAWCGNEGTVANYNSRQSSRVTEAIFDISIESDFIARRAVRASAGAIEFREKFETFSESRSDSGTRYSAPNMARWFPVRSIAPSQIASPTMAPRYDRRTIQFAETSHERIIRERCIRNGGLFRMAVDNAPGIPR